MANRFEKVRFDLATELRKLTIQHPHCQFISAVEYCSLLVSRCRLERVDEIRLDLAGLRDKDTGQCYFVELEKLSIFR